MKYDELKQYYLIRTFEPERRLVFVDTENYYKIFSHRILIAIVEKKINRLYISNANFKGRVKAHITKIKKTLCDYDFVHVEHNYIMYKGGFN